jgi:hypothetical protein
VVLAGLDRFDPDSVDLSVFSVEAPDKVLRLASFSISSEDPVLQRLLTPGNEYCLLLSRSEIRFLSAAGLAILIEHFAFPPECVCYGNLDCLLRPLPRGWNSANVPDFPALFEDFKKKKFTLLWRGSGDGFDARDFHRRCDGHRDTLTVILDTDGNIFGGFTPLEWELEHWTGYYRVRTTFLFTLRNLHNVRRGDLRSGPKGSTGQSIILRTVVYRNWWSFYVKLIFTEKLYH